MERIFYRKTTSIMFVAALLVILMLTCILLVMLTQMSSLKAQEDVLIERIQQARNDKEAYEKLLQDRDTIDYVRKWAEEHGKISDEDVQWLKDNL